MPQRDVIHHIVKHALIRDGWDITDDPIVISFGERFYLSILEQSPFMPIKMILKRDGSERNAMEN